MSAAAAKDATAEDGPGPSVIAASDIEVDREALDASIREFAGENGDYYVDKFHRIFEKTSPLPNTFNQAAALAGPAWAATRGVWAMFWAFLILEIIAWVQIGRGLWGNPGAEFSDRAETQLGRAQEFLDRAAAAREAGEDPSRFETLAGNLTRAAENSQAQATALGAEATTILLTGLGLLILFKLTQGLWANAAYEKQYSRWRIDASSVPSGFEKRRMWIGLALIGAIAPLTIYKFTVASPIEALNAFPEAALSGLFLATEGETLRS
ncbi:MAG: proline/glycine betaine ABC transporter permease, partial [Pseudomonadota bacterium]